MSERPLPWQWVAPTRTGLHGTLSSSWGWAGLPPGMWGGRPEGCVVASFFLWLGGFLLR